MEEPRLIKDWDELKECVSETHTLEIDIEGGNGWIHRKEDKDDNSGYGHYLSTHTFYGSTHAYSTKLLQECGFNVVLANWMSQDGKEYIIKILPYNRINMGKGEKYEMA